VAFATVVPRIGGLLPGAATSTSAYTLAFGVLPVLRPPASAINTPIRVRPKLGDH
jgi:hypothetical protein